MPDQIETLTYRLLDEPIESIPRYRLLRDVLQWPSDHLDMVIARDMVLHSRFVEELAEAQHEDGSFGRFMYEQVPVRNPLKSTEAAICRALSLGLEKDHPVLVKAVSYLEGILAGDISWPNRLDLTPGGEVGVRLIVCACLRLIDRQNETALQEAYKWRDIFTAAFAGGTFHEAEYLRAFEDIMGRPAVGKTQIAFSRYVLMLLSGILFFQTENDLVRHIINNNRGLYMVTNHSLRYRPLDFPSREGMRYIAAVELLAAFPGAVDIMQSVYDWIWEQRNSEGIWDFGSYARDGLQLPLSLDWRRDKRRVDCTVRMLCLLRKMQQTCDLQEKICHPL